MFCDRHGRGPVVSAADQIQGPAIDPKPRTIKASAQDKPICVFGFILCIAALFINSARSEYDEKYRPQYHFSPKRGWIGDPDGLIFFKNEYHLFWWGHAVSKDLVHWKEMPYPMQGGRGDFHYFTGSVVVDKNNTAGFGKDSLVAIYTMHDSATSKEAQGISYSEDGIKFQFYNQNPVLDLHNDDFRDPHVFWFEPSKHWVMAITKPKEHKVGFYASNNLKKWNHLSDFGPDGDVSQVWEVPDLFELPLNGNSNTKKWVLTVGVGPNRVQYFVGKFNGREFIKEKAEKSTLWADYGADFYAARTWRNYDQPRDSRIVWMGWMGNWKYANAVPTGWGRGFESVPRQLSLKAFPYGIRLVQTPVEEIRSLRGTKTSFTDQKYNNFRKAGEFTPKRNVYEILMTLHLDDAKIAGINLLEGGGRKLQVGYNAETGMLFIDRSNCSDHFSDQKFNGSFPERMRAPLRLKSGQIKLNILIDESSVEVFANDGEVTLSATTFPDPKQTGISFFAKGGATIKKFEAWELTSIWNR